MTFGMISIPVALVPAVRRAATPLHLVHTADGCLGRIRYRKTCELDGRHVTEQEVGRGYETTSGGLVPVTDADLDHLPLATAHTIELLGTVPSGEVDARRLGAGAYYLAAGDSPAGARPYLLLARILARRGQAVVVKLAVRGDRERIALLRPLGDALTLSLLRWPDEVRQPSAAAPAEAAVSDDELAAALALVAARSADSLDDIPGLVDHYGEALAALVDAKVHDRDLTEPRTGARPAQPVDLMGLLRASVDDARAGRGEPPAPRPAPPGRRQDPRRR
ncbi:Ku protein [Streptomyces sp. bgisy154]|uniref:non-homologous end joining protein Ku n=1 Tax=Streptomyces sp. bgisy154 TaxID=3413794 RepID=UPI003D74A0E8